MNTKKPIHTATPLTDTASGLARLDDRSRQIFRQLVESYLSTGDPVGSRNLARNLPMTLSPASVRNVMSDLEQLGLIAAPHTSAGRLPTQLGLRMFVDGLLEIGDLSEEERRQIEAQVRVRQSKSVDQVLNEAGELISGLSHCAGLILTEKQINRLKHIEFVALEPLKALVVLVGEDGNVENRIVALPEGLPPFALTEASNYLTAHIRGHTLGEARVAIAEDLQKRQAELDELTRKLVETGLATWSGAVDEKQSLIVRGRGNLLKGVNAPEDIERIRHLFDDLENKRELHQLLGLAEGAEGVRIFIGSENKMFSMSGSSLIVAPFQDDARKVVGVLGVIGPTRLNYARIIPMVDYTARLVGRLLT